MDSHFDTLLKNNDPPSLQAILRATELVAAPLKELDETNEGIQRLESHLKDLYAKRQSIQHSSLLKKCSAILSPIRRLPLEIVLEIFNHCPPAHRNPVISASEAPILLTRVCSSWRSIALSAPRLWARLNVSFSDDDCPDQYIGASSVSSTDIERAMKALQRRCTAVEEWLARSGSRPLSISVKYFRSARNRQTLILSQPTLTSKFLAVLARFAPRWKDINLELPLEVYRYLEAMISVDSLSTLTTFKANLSRNPRTVELFGPIRLLAAPNLKNVSFGYGTRPCDGERTDGLWTFINMPLVWGGLTYLCFHMPLSVSNALKLLRYSSNLVHCRLYIRGFGSVGHLDGYSSGPISLPHLRSLCVDQGKTQLPVGIISAPQLTWIDYQIEHPDEPSIMNLAPLELLPLLQKSTALRKLTLAPRLTALEMRSVLRIISQSNYNITHLVLGPEPVGPLRPIRRVSGSTCLCCSPNLKDALNFNFLDPFGLTESSEGIVVLPNLQVIEITYGTQVSDQDLLRFISRRMDPFSSHGVAVLKSIRVSFGRAREKDGLDVAEEVSQLAERMGIEVKLELDYLAAAPDLFSGRLRPSYGLKEDDSWPWGLADIEEEVVSLFL